MTNPMYGTPPTKKLHRSDDRIIAGVCSGVAEYLGIDTTLVRVITAVLVVFGGTGALIYLIAWLVMPDARGTVIAARRPAAAQPPAPQSSVAPPPAGQE